MKNVVVEQRKKNWQSFLNEIPIEKIAEGSSLSISEINNFINGTMLSANKLIRVAEITNHSVDFLIGLRDMDYYDIDCLISNNKTTNRIARERIDDLNYRLVYRNELGLRVAKKIMKLSDSELTEVDEMIDFIYYRKKLRLRKEDLKEN